MAEEERSPLARDEEKILKFWEENHIFEKSLKKNEKGKPFTFYDGPPFATGLPHYGHILASTIKDVIPRYQTMRGRFVRRRWGWDCHGLPIEEIVERKLGISGKKQIEAIGIKKFNETCRSMVLEYAHEWRKMIRRIARWVEFDDSYKTMDADYMESVWWAFKEIYKKKLVYEGRKVLLYCPRCETPVSNFEVAMDNSYKDVTEEAVTVKFKLKPGQKLGRFTTDDNTYILSWTTTPWTLPGNIALAVGLNFIYDVVDQKGTDQKEKWIVAREREGSILGVAGKSVIIVTKDLMSGSSLVGLEYEPLFNVPAAKSEKSFKIYPADFVTTDEGTGVVHTAVVYGEEDYALGLKEGLPIVPLLDEKGVFNDKAPELVRGKYFKDSEKFIKKDLEERGLLLERKMHQHSYPYCWRCGNVLFYNAIPAWFINIQKIKSKLLKSNSKEINWFPGHLKHGRYEKSVEAAPDWNISRNRYWGNPIPVWKCEKCKREEVVGGLEELSKRAGPTKNNYWVMRHGFSENLIHNILDSGQKELHLTPIGRDEVRRAIEKLKKDLASGGPGRAGKKIDMIISSDVLRTKETAEIASPILGVPAEFDKRLREIHLGVFDGCHDGKWQKQFPTLESRFEGAPEGGETLRDLRGRLWKFMEETERKHKGKNILLVSHEYPIWMLTHAAEAWSEKRAMQEKRERGDFVVPAQIDVLNLKIAPRNDSGEIDLHRPYIDEMVFGCNDCGGAMKRTPEIFDSWMEAGSMPFAEYHYPFENKKTFEKRLPAQFVAEYIAQTRAWFYVMHVVSFIQFGKAPFENVVTTGTILAEDGSKMSKSKENFPDPNLVIEKYGADSLRFYLMNSVVMQADNLNFSEKGVESAYRKVELLLRNVYKYFETYVPGVDEFKVAPGGENVLDRWIKARTDELVSGVTDYLDAYDTVHATRLIQEYIDDLSTWYLRRSRRREDEAFWVTLRDSLLTASKVIAPFMPFLAEELYQHLKSQSSKSGIAESVHLEEWPRVAKSFRASELQSLLGEMAEVRRFASLALAERAKAKIKVRQPLALLKIKSQISNLKSKKELLAILADEVNVKEVIFETVANPPAGGEVELDTIITPGLRKEGIVREVARMVQGLRQDAGLRQRDKVILMLEAADDIKKAIIENEASLVSDVGAKSIEYRKSDKFDAEEATKIDGEDVWVAIRKI